MEAPERVGAVPVPTGAVTSFHYHDVGLALGDQRVGERHPRRAAAHHQVVRLDGFQRCAPCWVVISGVTGR